MPRQNESFESRCIKFFRTAPLDVAELVLGLCQGEVKGRRPSATGRLRKPAPKRASVRVSPLPGTAATVTPTNEVQGE